MTSEELALKDWVGDDVGLLEFLPADVAAEMKGESSGINLDELARAGGFTELFERVGLLYVLKLRGNDRRLLVRLQRSWSESAWSELNKRALSVEISKEEIGVMEPYVTRLVAEPAQLASSLGKIVIAHAAGRRYWRAIERIAQRIDVEDARVLRRLMVKAQLEEHHAIDQAFRKTLANFFSRESSP
ncbi:hypothetical protein FRD01_07540 [Microvenator marinus]|jgi:hypothetical protein|uniref:Uncharacterized protein n=1 Tax=Microvenator marinus TaxID=2600177 RepID=A0A5B8XNP4_9DELT|nr:hypothetical protein [Microvenator marinus]QED27095.1 hypothetical protein FRD01_07540 [Microvenator marinus]